MPIKNNNLLNKSLFFTFVATLFLINFTAHAQNNSITDSLTQSIEAKPNDTSKVNEWHKLSNNYYTQGKYQKSLEVAQKALQLSNKLNYDKGKANAYGAIGVNSYELKRYDEALKNQFHSVKIREQLKDTGGISLCYSNIASVYAEQEDFKIAIEYLFLAIRLAEIVNDQSKLAVAYNRIGIIYKKMLNFTETKKYLIKALECNTRIKNEKGVATNYLNLGHVCKHLKEFEDAALYYQKAMLLNKSLERTESLLDTYASIAMLHIEHALSSGISQNIKDSLLQVSLFNFNEALKIQQQSNSQKPHCEIQVEYGRLMVLMERYETGRKYLLLGIDCAYTDNDISLLGTGYDYLSKLDSAYASSALNADSSRLFWRSAYLNAQQSEKYKYELINEDNTKQIAEIKTKYETEKKDNEIKLLGKDNELKSARLSQQSFALQLSFLEKEKNQDEIVFLNKDKVLNALQLTQTQQELKNRELENKTKAAELELIKKDKLIKEKQLAEQTVYRNIIVVGSVFLFVIGLLLFNRFRLNKKIESQQALLNERKRISNELHDDLGAQLSTARMFLNTMKNNTDGDKNKMLVENSIQLIDGSINDLRKIMDDLQVSTLQQKGYLAATEELVNKINMLQQINFTLSHSGLEKRLEEKIEHNLFRITQELINNSMKYAKAKNVTIDLVNRDGVVVLLYEDDGIGFDPTNNKRGYGLSNIETRTQNINGSVEFDSSPGNGARTIIEIPLVYA